jgi:LAO/AO transport system kinase
MSDLVQAVLEGNRRALARLLTIIENESEGAEQALATLFPHTGHARIIGITGAPGTGKSSLVNVLAKCYRAQGKTVAIVAIDPTSPFTGGAILGDRIRMRDHSGDSGVFIRSMATRGSLGGLAKATRDMIRAFDAAHYDVILVETVGAGQSEVDIVRTAQTTVVVDAPGMGDDVQAIKAGILEIADVLVVNKADHPSAKNTVRALRAMLELGHPASRSRLAGHHGQIMRVEFAEESAHADIWIPPIVETIATTSIGVEALVDAIASHGNYLESNNNSDHLEHQRLEVELYDRLQVAMMRRLMQHLEHKAFEEIIQQVKSRELDPQAAVEIILAHYLA